ncbi:MAG TPA: hypothetical protein VGV90_12580 [Solirubrobacteraceae bacterium]|nr:hypothetical protein [Solirubrobacteraceae bacterium]
MSPAAPIPEGWPDPNERTCDDCGHVWFAGERRHEYVEPEAARPEDSDVVCVLCRQRERPRSKERWAGF